MAYKSPMIRKSQRGSLHRALGVAQGRKIPKSTLRRVAKTGSPAMRKKAQFALNFNKGSR